MSARLLGVAAISSLLLGSLAPRPASAEESLSDDPAIRFLDSVDGEYGRPASPTERKLRATLENLAAAGESAGGFEAPPDSAGAAPDENDDTQYTALQELLAKMSPLERVKAGVWFLVIRPKTPHREEVTAMIDTSAAGLSPNERAEFNEYMNVRRSLIGSDYDMRIERWTAYAKQKPQGLFAELSKREVQHIQTLQQDKSAERKSGAFRMLVKIGIVSVVLLLLVVIALGAM